MKIYQVLQLDMMGFECEPSYWSTIELAKQEYEKQYKKLAKDPHLVKEDDEDSLDEMQSRPIVETEVHVREENIRETSFALWYKSSYEYDEWDVTLVTLILKEIEVDKGMK